MAKTTDLQVSGIGSGERVRIKQAIAEALRWKSGKWHVQLIGDQISGMWEMRVSGPGTEISEFLDKSLGQHEPAAIAAILTQLLPD